MSNDGKLSLPTIQSDSPLLAQQGSRAGFEKAAAVKTPLLNMAGNGNFTLSDGLAENIGKGVGKNGADTGRALHFGIAFTAACHATKDQAAVDACYAEPTIAAKPEAGAKQANMADAGKGKPRTAQLDTPIRNNPTPPGFA